MELLLLCIKIFFARIIDVSLGTIRMVYIIKEQRIIATIIAFFEVLIWFEISRESLNNNINSIIIPIAYASGYSAGTYIGTFISTKFVQGNVLINVISSTITNKNINELKKNKYGVSVINMCNNKKMLMIEIDKKRINELKSLILKYDKKAFIIINDTKIVQNGFIK